MKRSRQSPAFLAALFRQLADALKAGLSPRDTLAILAADRDLGKRQAQLIARLREGFDVELAQRALFESPNVAGLAAEIERLLAEKVPTTH